VYVAGHALVKAALFLCTGIVLHRQGSVNESWLHGRARHLRVTGVVFTLAAFGLADLPPFATFAGKIWIEASVASRGLALVTAVLVISSVLVGGAVLRVAAGSSTVSATRRARIRRWPGRRRKRKARQSSRGRTPLTMIIPAAVLVIAAIVIGVLPHLGPAVQAQAVRFQDQGAYTATVLNGAHVAHPAAVYPQEIAGLSAVDLAGGAASAAGAVVLALAALYWRRLPVLRRGFEPGQGLAGPITAFQSGVINDYVTWIVLGVAGLGGAMVLAFR
jgi:multicomponent Na+:H+ antiporter subunit D